MRLILFFLLIITSINLFFAYSSLDKYEIKTNCQVINVCNKGNDTVFVLKYKDKQVPYILHQKISGDIKTLDVSISPLSDNYKDFVNSEYAKKSHRSLFYFGISLVVFVIMLCIFMISICGPAALGDLGDVFSFDFG